LGGEPMTDDERRLLELLAKSADDCTDSLLLGYGFKLKMMVRLVGAGQHPHATPSI
jgi:hypothetical protein